MKKLFFSIAPALAALPRLAFAQPAVTAPGPGSGVPTEIIEFYGLACEAANWVFAFVLLLGVFGVLWAAVGFLTSRGDEERVAEARRHVTYTLVGVAIAILARSLIFVVGNFLGVANPEATLFAC